MSPSSPRLVLAAFTHFGAMGLKGNGMYYLVWEAWRRQYLQKAIVVSKKSCRYEFDLRLVNTLPGESRLISLFSEIKQRVWKEFPSRWLGEIIFDHYAASQLPRVGGVLVTTPRLVQTVRKAKTLGYTTLLYGGAPHPQLFLEQIQRENEALGLQKARQRGAHAWEMSRFATHVASSDYIIAVSEFAKESYAQRGFPSERIFVTPLGVNVRQFRATPVPESLPFTYLFVAQVDGATGILKGLHYLLQAWDELSLPNARLLVCGRMGHEVQTLMHRYAGNLRGVEFVGFVSNIEDYYRQASVFVFPTLAEGLAKVVLEAMASGRPVITTPVLKPVVREGLDGFYVPLRDVTALKERMLYFHQHRNELGRMGKNAAEQAQRFTWERFSRQIADIVATVAAG